MSIIQRPTYGGQILIVERIERTRISDQEVAAPSRPLVGYQPNELDVGPACCSPILGSHTPVWQFAPRRGTLQNSIGSMHGSQSDMALLRRRPQDVIRHSDQGCHTSIAFGSRCRDANMRPSMGSVGDCFDNAMCESFFATRSLLAFSRTILSPSSSKGSSAQSHCAMP